MFERFLQAAIVIVLAYVLLHYLQAPPMLKQMAYAILFLIVFFFVMVQVTAVLGVHVP